MTDKLFDDFIRQKMDAHASGIPEGMWERIGREREKRKPKPIFTPLKYWWAIALPFLALGIWFAARTTTPAGSKAISPAQQPASGQPQNGNASATTSPADNQSAATTNPPNKTTSNTNASANNISGTTHTSVNPNPSANRPSASPNATADANPANNSNKRTTAPAVDNKRPATDNRITDFDIQKAAQKAKRNRNLAIARGIVAPGAKTKVQAQRLNDPAAAGNDKRLPGSGNPQMSHETTPAFRLLPPLPPKEKNNFSFGDNNLRSNRYAVIPPPDKCPTLVGPKRNDWYAEIYVSPDYAFKNVSAPNNRSAYLKKKDSTESFGGAFSAGINISKSISNHLLLKTGLRYSQINEKFDYVNEKERRFITVITERTITDAAGNIITIRDTSVVEQTGTRVKRTYNRFRSLDIPLLLSYETGNDVWKFNFTAGPVINLRSWYRGAILDTTFLPLNFNAKSATGIYKTNVGLGVFGSVSILRSISDNMEVFAEPYFRYNFSDITTGRLPFTQRFSTAGIQFGIRYHLNGLRQRRY
jgi:cytoskeletal protein RodZ